LDATKHPEIKKAANDGGEVVDLKSGTRDSTRDFNLGKAKFLSCLQRFQRDSTDKIGQIGRKAATAATNGNWKIHFRGRSQIIRLRTGFLQSAW